MRLSAARRPKRNWRFSSGCGSTAGSPRPSITIGSYRASGIRCIFAPRRNHHDTSGTRDGLMARRTIVVDGNVWKVSPAGRLTVYGKDEFSLAFELGTGPERKRRFTRYSPRGSQKRADAALAEVTERELLDLSPPSQPAWTSPEGASGVL